MKPIYKISLVALALIGLSACNQEQKKQRVPTKWN